MLISLGVGARHLTDDPDKLMQYVRPTLCPPSSHLRSEIHNSAPGWWPRARQVILTQASRISQHKHPAKWFYSTPNVPGYSPNTLTGRHAGWLQIILEYTMIPSVGCLISRDEWQSSLLWRNSVIWMATNKSRMKSVRSRPSAPSAAQLTLR